MDMHAVIPNNLVKLILLRLDSPVCLVRAASTCKRWRRIIADSGFLRHFRSLQAPTVAGDYYNDFPLHALALGPKTSGCPFFAPSSSAAIDIRYFSLDFLPDRNFSRVWTVQDSRGSLLLLNRFAAADDPAGFPYLIVCEPLTRRYRRIPPPANFNAGCQFFGYHLLDGDEDQAGGRVGMSNFRVLCELYRDGTAHAAVFNFNAGSDWHSWRETAIDHIAPRFELMRFLGRAGGSFYWYVQGNTVIVLDGGTAEFSSFALPPDIESWDLHMWSYNFCVTGGRDGKPRIFSVVNDNLKVFARVHGSDDWALEKRIELSEATRVLPGYKPSFFGQPLNVCTTGVGSVVLSPREQWWLFSVDLETMVVQQRAAEHMGTAYPCELPWPPALHACVD